MATVSIAPEAREQFAGLPTAIKARVLAVFERLGRWPSAAVIMVVRIGRRDGFYDD